MLKHWRKQTCFCSFNRELTFPKSLHLDDMVKDNVLQKVSRRAFQGIFSESPFESALEGPYESSVRNTRVLN